MSGTFSKRLGLGSNKGLPIYNDAPKGLRIGLWNLIEDLVDHKILPTALPNYETLYNKLTAAFHLERTKLSYYDVELEAMVLNLFAWNEVFDVIQFLFTEVYYYSYDEQENEWMIFPAKFSDARYQYTIKVNSILSTENIGWKLKSGFLERSGNETLDSEVLIKARKLLSNPAYQGPNEQFNSALKFFNQRPAPDKVNCIKEAVGALEGLARVLLKDPTVTLGKATDIFVKKGIIKKPFDRTFHALFGYASEMPGARHGAHDLPDIDMYETEFVLYSSASCMVLLAGCHPFNIIPEKPAEIRAKELEKPVISDFPEEEFPENDPTKEEEDPPEFPGDDEVPF